MRRRLGGTAASPDPVRDWTDGSTAAPPSTPSTVALPASPGLSDPVETEGVLLFDEHDQATLRGRRMKVVRVYCRGVLKPALVVDEGVAVCCCGKRLRVVT